MQEMRQVSGGTSYEADPGKRGEESGQPGPRRPAPQHGGEPHVKV